ncbi:MAG: hypothetical protein JO264_10225 [Acidisphaera sp.]|nr:hypothetical protein [Acidisphaera sp.]
MGRQPRLNRRGLAAGQQIDGPALLEIAHLGRNGSIGNLAIIDWSRSMPSGAR